MFAFEGLFPVNLFPKSVIMCLKTAYQYCRGAKKQHTGSGYHLLSKGQSTSILVRSGSARLGPRTKPPCLREENAGLDDAGSVSNIVGSFDVPEQCGR